MSDDNGKFGSFVAGYIVGGMGSPRPARGGVRAVVILAALLLAECVSHDAHKTAIDLHKNPSLKIHHVSHLTR